MLVPLKATTLRDNCFVKDSELMREVTLNHDPKPNPNPDTNPNPICELAESKRLVSEIYEKLQA